MKTETPMTTDQKLQAIKDKCHELLALSEKRTPGRWEAHDRSVYKKDWLIISAMCHEQVAEDCPIIPDGEQQANAAFIAACAGASEAGWRATIAAIDELLTMGEEDLQACQSPAAILTAWEGQGLWT